MRMVAVATALGLGLAGCTGFAQPTPSVSVPGMFGIGSGTTSGGGPIGSGDVCTAYPTRQVAKDSGWTLTAADASVTAIGGLSPVGCRYAGADGTLQLLVIRGGGDAAITALMSAPELGGGAIAMTGVGDAAQAARDGVAVRYGDDVVAVVEQPAATPLTLATSEHLVTSLKDRLAR
jgi:hypothetical protein